MTKTAIFVDSVGAICLHTQNAVGLDSQFAGIKLRGFNFTY